MIPICRHFVQALALCALAMSVGVPAQAGPREDLFAMFEQRGANEQEIRLTYKESDDPAGLEFKLQAIVYRPDVSNGRLVLFSHGSVTSPEEKKVTYRLWPIAKQFTDQGYTFVIWMRAGRGQSEGEAEEFSGRDCDVVRTDWSLIRNRDQMRQVIAQLRERYDFKQIFLVGHSRGGILSANYATHYPTGITAVINLAGAYNEFCDPYTGNHSWTIVKDSVAFSTQRWIYYTQDTFFSEAYRSTVRDTARMAGLQYFEIPGHHASPLLKPGWIPGALKWFDSVAKSPVNERTSF